MRLTFKSSSLLLSAFLLLPSLAKPGAITLNGSCELGNCAAVDSVSYGNSTGTVPFNFTYIAGSDTYQIAGDYSAYYDSTGTNFNVYLNAIYTGSTPSKTSDSINFNLLQNFYDNSPGTWDGQYGETIPLTLSSNAGMGSTVSAQLLYDGQSVGLLGPYGPGSYSGVQSANLSGLTGDYLDAEYQFMINFAAGTQTGATVFTSAAPEPALGWPVAGALAVLGMLAVRGRCLHTKLAR